MTRRRPRLFSFSRDVELGQLADLVQRPEDLALLERMVDAFIAIARAHAVEPHTLAPFAEGARHPLAPVRGMAITRLTVLTHYFDEAAEVFATLCRDASDEVRLFACAALANTPAKVGLPLLDEALTDDVWRVRKAAAQTGSATVWPGLLDVLRAHRGAEADARVGVVLDLAIDFQTAHADAA